MEVKKKTYRTLFVNIKLKIFQYKTILWSHIAYDK